MITVPIREPIYPENAESYMSRAWAMWFELVSRRTKVKKGTTAQRPTLGADDAGMVYFDTTLAADGQPIFWTGSAWVDYLGVIA